MLRVGIAGGSGYGGMETAGLLLRHPRVEIVSISSNRNAGTPVSEVYPHLKGRLDIEFTPLEETIKSDLDVLFLALPHGEAMRVAPSLREDLLLIDLSGDFRISDPAVFEEYYGFEQTEPEIQQQFVYGLPEINRDRISQALRIANPGCFATATILALYPLYREGWIEGPVYVDAKTGSSGSGRTPRETTHHPRRSQALFPYKPFRHQHLPEMRQLLGREENPLVFQTHSAPMIRGIYSSHYMGLKQDRTADQVRDLFQDYYQQEPFIRWQPTPDVAAVQHSNYVDLGGATDGSHLIIWSTLDNLQKGAGGQAIQNMNIMLGFPENLGIDAPPQFP